MGKRRNELFVVAADDDGNTVTLERGESVQGWLPPTWAVARDWVLSCAMNDLHDQLHGQDEDNCLRGWEEYEVRLVLNAISTAFGAGAIWRELRPEAKLGWP
jgi:hypothetical protein